MKTISNEQRVRNFMSFGFKVTNIGGLSFEESEWAGRDSDVFGDERFRNLYILKILEALKLYDIDDASFVDNIPQIKEPRFTGFDSFSDLDKEVCDNLDQLSTYTLATLAAVITAKAGRIDNNNGKDDEDEDHIERRARPLFHAVWNGVR